MRKLSIIIPCYNESRTIREILSRVKKAPLPAYWEHEIIIVDDGSTDGTCVMLAEYEEMCTVVYQKHNSGKGSAVREGLLRATGEYCIVQDADLEYDPKDIAQMLSVLDRGEAEIVYGSRNLRPRERSGAYIRRLGVWFLTRLLNGLYGLSLTDVWTCYKLFLREAAGDFPAGGFESELRFTVALARRGYRFAEVPIAYHPRTPEEGKKIRYRDGFFAIIVIVKDYLRG